MSDDKPSTDSGSTASQSPSETLDDLLEDTIQTIEHAGHGIQRFKAERKQVERFGEEAAPIIAEHTSARSGPYADKLSDVCNDWNKTEIRNLIDEKVEEHDPHGEDRPQITAWLDEHLDRVVEIRSTDRLINTRWRWEASDPDHGQVSWETKRTGDGIQHNQYEQLQALIQEATGKYVCDPPVPLRDGGAWSRYIAEIVEEFEEVEPSRGPRTAAFDRLKEWISRHRAYIDMADVVDRGGMRIDRDNGELHIRTGDIQRVCEAEEITPETFQSELSVRGVLSERVRGATEQTTVKVDGEYQVITYWVFDIDAVAADPYEVVEEPETAAEAEADASDDQDADDDDDAAEADASSDPETRSGSEWSSERVGSVDPYADDSAADDAAADEESDADAADASTVEDIDPGDVDPEAALGEYYEFLRDRVESMDAPTVGDVLSEFGETFDESDADAIAAVIEEVTGDAE